jgi:hypothetical protein
MRSYRSDVRPPVYTTIYNFVDHLIQYLLSKHSPERALPLIVADRGIPPQDSPVIYYNTEQLTRPEEFARITERLRASDITAIWDYSIENIKILQNAGFTNVHHVPVRTIPETVRMLQMVHAAYPQKYDIGFCGAVSERRKAILEELSRRGIRVNVITAWGGVRDREIAQCCAVMNIHNGDDYTVFESVRCEPWLAAGVPVITESSMDDDSRCAVIAPYNELVDKTVSFIRGLREGSTCPQTCPSSP